MRPAKPLDHDGSGFGRCRNIETPGGCRGGQCRRGPRMFDQGMLRYVVLKHIALQPRHGYDLIKLLQEQSGGFYTPSPGMIYPMLSMLEDLGYVSVSAEGNKKLYTLTGQGRDFLQQNQAMVAAVEEQIAARRSVSTERLRERMQALRDTVCILMRSQQLSPEQIRKIESVLDRANAEIQAL